MSYHGMLSNRSLKHALRLALSPRGLAIGALSAPIMALAGPTGAQVAAGAASISTPAANGTVIDQTTPSAVINWQSFNIGNQEYVQFNQPDSSSVVLNRVVGGTSSSILGSLTANGQVFLVNPQGVFFGKGATLDVGGLLATTMDISDSDFMAGHYVFTEADGSAGASVVNAGAIQAHPGGYVVLAGDYTENSGVITAQAGHVVLAAGSQMTLDIGSGGLINYAVDQATLSSLAGVKNAGQIIADGGTVVMTAKVANSLVTTAVNNEGLVRAHSVTERNGVIILSAQGGDITDSGTLDASATDSGVTGGYIRIRGDGRTEITSTASIDASGDGARGGFVELSGHTLSLRGKTVLGHGGTLLIDPAKLSIATGSTAPSSTGATTYQVGAGYITNQLNSNNNVVLVASNSIGHAAGVTSLTATGTGNLTIKTGTLSAVTTGASLGPSGFQCWADGVCTSPAAGAGGATFTPTSGTISLNGMSINIAGAFTANAGTGSVGLGNVTANAGITVQGGAVTQATGSVVNAPSGVVNIAATNLVQIAGNVSGANGVNITAGSVTVGNVTATTGSVNLNASGFSPSMSVGSVNAGLNVNISATGAASGLSARVNTGPVTAGGFASITATAHQGAQITIAGAISAQGVNISGSESSSGYGFASVHQTGGITGTGTAGSDGINVVANAPGGTAGVSLSSGTISAAGGQGIHISAAGVTGNVTVGGAMNAVTVVGVSAANSVTVANVSAPNIQMQAKQGNLTAGNLVASDSTGPVSVDVGTGPSGTTGGAVSIGSITASGKEGASDVSGANVHIYARANSGANITVGGITVSAAKAHYSRSGSYPSGSGTFSYNTSGSSGRAHLNIAGGGAGAKITVNGSVSVSGYGIASISMGGAPSISVSGAIAATDLGAGNRTLDWTKTSGSTVQHLHRVSPHWGAARVSINGLTGSSGGNPSSAGSVSLGSVSANGIFGDIFIQGGTITTGALTATGSGRTGDVRTGSYTKGGVTKNLSSSDNSFGSANVTVQAYGGSSANVNVTGAISVSGKGQALVNLAGAHVQTQGITVSATSSHINLLGDVIPSSASYVSNYRSFKLAPDTLTLGANLTHGTASMGVAYIEVGGAIPLGTGTSSPAPASSFAASGNLSVTGVGDASMKLGANNVSVTGSIAATATKAHINASGSSTGGVTTTVTGSLGAAGVDLMGASASGSVSVTGTTTVSGPMARVRANAKTISLGNVSVTGSGMNRTVTQSSGTTTVFSSHLTNGPAMIDLTGGTGSNDSTATVSAGNLSVSGLGGADLELHAGNISVGSLSAAFGTGGTASVSGTPTGLTSSLVNMTQTGAQVGAAAFNSVSAANVSAPHIWLQAHHGAIVVGSLNASSTAAPATVSLTTGLSGSTSPSVGGSISVAAISVSGKQGASGQSGGNVWLKTGAKSGANIIISGGITVSAARGHYIRSTGYTGASSSSHLFSSGSRARAGVDLVGGGAGASISVGGAISVTGSGVLHVNATGASSVSLGSVSITDNGGSSLTQTITHSGSGVVSSFHRTANNRGNAGLNITTVSGSYGGNATVGNVSLSGVFAGVSITGATIQAGSLTLTATGRNTDGRSGTFTGASGTKHLSSSDNNFGTAHAILHAIGGSSANVTVTGNISATAQGGQAFVDIRGAHVATKGITVSASASTVHQNGDIIPSSGLPYMQNYRNLQDFKQFLSLGAPLATGTVKAGIASIAISGALSSPSAVSATAPATSFSASGSLSATGVGSAQVVVHAANVNISGGVSAAATRAQVSAVGADSLGYKTTLSGQYGGARVEVQGGSANSNSVSIGGSVAATGPMAEVMITGKHLSLGAVSATGTGMNRSITQVNSASSTVFSAHTTDGPARIVLTGGSGSYDSISTISVGNVTASGVGGASVQIDAGSVTGGNITASSSAGSLSQSGYPYGLNSSAMMNVGLPHVQVGAFGSASVGNLSAPDIDIRTKHGALVAGNITASSANAPVRINVQGGTSGSGASVTINGNVTASGRGSAGTANPFSGAGSAAQVHIDAGYGSHAMSITGNISVTGAAAPVSAHSSDSYTYALVGSLGRADLTLGQSSTTGATINVGGSVSVVGAGEAHAGLTATSVNVGGPVKVSATPTTFTQSSTYFFGSGSHVTSGGKKTIQTGGVANLTISAAQGASGAVSAGAITVSGNVGSVSIRGHSVTVGNVTVNTLPGTFDLTSTGHGLSGSFALTSHASAGIARVEVTAGTSGSLGTANLGAINISGNGLAEVRVGAGVITTGAITVAGGAGTFTRTQSGSPHYYGSLYAGPMALWQSLGLDRGTASVGGASVSLDGMVSSYGSYGRPPAAASINVGGAISVTGKGTARLDLAGDSVSVASTVDITATKGHVVGSGQYVQTTSSSATYSVARTMNDSAGSAGLSLGHSGGAAVTVGGAIAVSGTTAGVEVLGANINVMGIAVTANGSGHVSESAVYTPTSSAGPAGFSTSFKGPGDITGVRLIGSPSGSMSVAGDIVIQGKGFVGTVIADGTVNVRNISLTASGSASYTVTDTRNSTATRSFTIGDVGLVLAQMAGASSASPATVSGNITLSATRDVHLGVAGSASGVVTVAAGRDIRTGTPSSLPALGNARGGPGSSGSSIFFPTPDISASAAAFTAGRNISMSGATVTVGSGSITGMSGDAKVTNLAGFGSAAPNAVFDAAGALKMPSLVLTGNYAWLRAGTFVSAGSATVPAGALIQISPHVSTSSIGIDPAGSGSQATMIGVTPFLSAYSGSDTIAIGGSAQTGDIVLGGNVNLGNTNLILMTSGLISGSGQVAAGSLTLAATGANTTLSLQTPVLNFVGSGSLTINDSSYTGTASINLGSGNLTAVTGTFGGNVNLLSPVNAANFTFTAAGSINLSGQTLNIASAASFTVGSSFQASGATINAGSLTLNGGSATDFQVTANAASITVGGGRNIGIKDTFAGPATMALGGGSFGSVALSFAKSATVTGSFGAQGLQVAAGGALSLGSGVIQAGSHASLNAAGALSNSGRLVANTIDVSAGGPVNLITRAASIQVAAATDVTLDNTARTGSASVGFGSGTFGAVAVNFGGNGKLVSGLQGSALGMTAGGSLDISGQTITVSGAMDLVASSNIVMTGVNVSAGTVSMTAGGSIHNGSTAGTVKASALSMIAVGDILVPNTTFTIGSGSVAGIYGDAQLIQGLTGQGLAPLNANPNATFIAGGSLDIGGLNFSGSYLYLQAQNLTLPSSVTAPNGVLVQFSPYTTSSTIGLEAAPASTATVNYSNQADLSLFPGGTLVIGSSAETGDVSIGANGPFDIGTSNLVIATSGNITGLGNVTSTGLVTDLETLLNGVFEVPTTTEVDPTSGSTLSTGSSGTGSGSSGSGSSDDDKKKKDDGSGDNSGSGDESNTLIKQEQSDPSGICT